MVLGIFIFHFPGRYMLSYWLRRKKNLPYYSKKETLFCVSALCLVIQTLLPFQLSFFLCLIIKKRLSLIHFSSVRECSWYLKSCCLVFQSEHIPECTWTPRNQATNFLSVLKYIHIQLPWLCLWI